MTQTKRLFSAKRATQPLKLIAMRDFVRGNSDVFVNFPTGYGKSLVYQALPSIFDILAATPGYVVVIF